MALAGIQLGTIWYSKTSGYKVVYIIWQWNNIQIFCDNKEYMWVNQFL